MTGKHGGLGWDLVNEVGKELGLNRRERETLHGFIVDAAGWLAGKINERRVKRAGGLGPRPTEGTRTPQPGDDGLFDDGDWPGDEWGIDIDDRLAIDDFVYVTVRDQKVWRRDVLRALEQFDAMYANTNDYDNGWLDKKNYHYVLLHEDCKYPPKHILSEASGIPESEFTGGEYTNGRLRQLGFEVVDK